MSDMSVSHREKTLDDVKQEQERQLQARLDNLRAQYQKREAELRESGDAAVNHIKKNNDTRIEQIRTSGETKLKRESEAINRNYTDLRRRSSHNAETLQEQIRSAEDNANNRIQALKHNEDRTIRQTNEQLRQFVERQKELRTQARQEANHEIEGIRRQSNEQIQQVKVQGSDQFRKTEKDQKAALENLKSRNQETYRETKSQADRRVEDVRIEGDEKIEKDRAQKNRALTEIQRKYKEAANVGERDGQRRLTDIQKREKQKAEETRDRTIRQSDEMRTQYTLETQRIQVEGEAEIAQRQSLFEQLQKKQKRDNDQALRELSQQLTAQEIKALKESEARLQALAQKQDGELKNQTKEFKERYDISDKTYKSSLHNQKETALRELYRQKLRFDEKAQLESDRSTDSFYRLKTFDARLEEEPTAYRLNAKVPAHEKDTVDVIIKDNKITLSAKRAYQDTYKGDDGDRTSTSTYQTYRQDFKLDVPVAAEKSYRKIGDDGSIVIIAPKKGYDKKA